MAEARAAPARSNGSRRPRRSHAMIHVVLGVGGLVIAFPFVWQIITSLSSNSRVRSVVPTFWPGTLQRHDFARLRFRGRGVLLGVVLSTLLIPPQVYLLSQYQVVLGLGRLNSIQGIVAPGLSSAFGTSLTRTAFVNLPTEPEEAARIDGASPWQIFWRVVAPLVRPSPAVLVITTTLFSWNELLWPLVVSTRADLMPLAAGLAQLSGSVTVDHPVVMAASLMAAAPVLIAFVVLQRRVIDGLASWGLKWAARAGPPRTSAGRGAARTRAAPPARRPRCPRRARRRPG